MTCTHCGRSDHSARAHHDPDAAMDAATDAMERGDKIMALHWFRVTKKLANQQARDVRGFRTRGAI